MPTYLDRDQMNCEVSFERHELKVDKINCLDLTIRFYLTMLTKLFRYFRLEPILSRRFESSSDNQLEKNWKDKTLDKDLWIEKLVCNFTA